MKHYYFAIYLFIRCTGFLTNILSENAILSWPAFFFPLPFSQIRFLVANQPIMCYESYIEHILLRT